MPVNLRPGYPAPPGAIPKRTVFTVPAVPVAQPRQKIRTFTTGAKKIAVAYLPKKHPVNAFKAAVQLAYREAAGPSAPIDGPVIMFMRFVLPRPKSLVWKTKPMPRLPHTTKSDVENLCKSVMDSLTGLAYRDDAQVCELHAWKMIAAGDEYPHVTIEIQEV